MSRKEFSRESLLPGQVLPNGLVLERLLARGGLSNVWLASNKGYRLVVKTFRRDPEWTEDQSQRCYDYFVREARYLQSLAHPRIVKGLGTVSLIGEVGILLEYLPGVNLRRWMDTHAQPRTLEQFRQIAISIAEGLKFVHASGLIHRDIAPRNLMINGNLVATLIDFQFACPHPSDLARQDFETGKPMTCGLGHWAYTAPEIMDGFDTVYDYRVDIYSLGAVLIELLVGRPPRRRPPQEWRPDVPPRLAECLWAMVDELPANRPSWQEIEQVLDSIR
ncbi:serine/threonine-protein kinase [Thermogutta sp.]|uniref:serine/threonine-protein kinase n=1 Tax=Thermogutta sp. TaxID=1962930 RepID=UPI003C79BDC5